jgi:hypothetical protein
MELLLIHDWPSCVMKGGRQIKAAQAQKDNASKDSAPE